MESRPNRVEYFQSVTLVYSPERFLRGFSIVDLNPGVYVQREPASSFPSTQFLRFRLVRTSYRMETRLLSGIYKDYLLCTQLLFY